MLGKLGTPGSMRDIPLYVYENAWKHSGDHSTLQRFSNSDPLASQAFGNFAGSDAVYSTGSFLRLRNFSFSYNIIPAAWKSIKIQSFKLFVQAQNLFVITKYLGLDPEIQNPQGIPPLKVLTGGVQLAL
jgi:hypothetical protein